MARWILSFIICLIGRKREGGREREKDQSSIYWSFIKWQQQPGPENRSFIHLGILYGWKELHFISCHPLLPRHSSRELGRTSTLLWDVGIASSSLTHYTITAVVCYGKFEEWVRIFLKGELIGSKEYFPSRDPKLQDFRGMAA